MAEKRVRVGPSPEVAAIGKLESVFNELKPEAQQRVLAWLQSRYAKPIFGPPYASPSLWRNPSDGSQLEAQMAAAVENDVLRKRLDAEARQPHGGIGGDD